MGRGAAALAADAALHDILGGRFRANPCFRLREHRALPEEERRAFAELAEDPDHFGLLVPDAGSRLGVQALDRAAARLFTNLREPGPLPDELRIPGSPAHNHRVALLVSDGVLELEHEGRFRSGPDAHAAILRRPFDTPRPRGRIAERSHEVLRRAQAVPIDDAKRLCAWIYAAGAFPVGPDAARRFRDAEAVQRAVGLGPGTERERRLAEAYAASEVPGWSAWHRDGCVLGYAEEGGDRAAYKLYVSPHPRALPEVFAAFLDGVLDGEVPAFKLGRDAWGVHRPDKLIAYFDDFASLEAFARELLPRIEGLAAHGVPFTAGLDEEGLLSWGVDPPRANRIPGWRDAESWRTWLAARLARAILRARVSPVDGVEPWVCALDRVRLEGVDPDGWLPSRALWEGQVAR